MQVTYFVFMDVMLDLNSKEKSKDYRDRWYIL